MNQTDTASRGATEAAPQGGPSSSRASSSPGDARAFLRKPVVGATVAGGVVLAAGAMFGVTEALVAGAVAYGVFRALKKSPGHAESA